MYVKIPRHHGMDWLRICAFGLLILFHIGLIFTGWGYHIQVAEPWPWMEYLLLLTTPWRLSLLFFVSGFASRAMLSKRRQAVSEFFRQRTIRLMAPWLFGAFVIVPPQSWVELVTKHDYAQDFLTFWFGDYFTWGIFEGIFLPTYNHLWFLLYLFAYTAILSLSLALVPERGKRWLGRMIDVVLGRAWAWLALPLVLLWIIMFLLYPRDGLTAQIFVGDWYRHATYLTVFLIGFALAGSDRLWRAIRIAGPFGFGLAALGYVFQIFFFYLAEGMPVGLRTTGGLSAFTVQAWGMITGLLWAADRYWNKDHPWRSYLAQGVFPFYIAHQTALIVVAYWVAAWRPALQFPTIVLATVLGCWAFYELARRSGRAKLAFGLS